MRFSPLSCQAGLVALLLPLAAAAQTTPSPSAAQPQWHLLDPQQNNGVMGLSAERTYQELLKGRTATPVTVAVIDGGVDTAHVDLRGVMWHNPKEIAGNGKDDDGNGYIDDVYGWNFLGGQDGRNIDVEAYEDTRMLARLEPLYQGKTRNQVPAAKREEFDLYQQVKKSYQTHYKEDNEHYDQYKDEYPQTQAVADQMKQALGVSRLDTATLRNPPTDNADLRRISQLFYQNLKAGGYADMESVLDDMKHAYEQTKNLVEYSLDLKFNPRSIVGDDPDNLKQRVYGNADVTGPDPTHGTHVAGIIAGDRTNNVGIMGVAGLPVRIMAVRAVPNGDERDKDVANAIRYAVDNGAQVINMSFGKYFSPHREAVEEAIRYADTKGVLLVHSAGNESIDIDTKKQYPSPVFLNTKTIPNLITVGASSRTNDQELVADFSNYGKKNVDVFAPGVQINSTLPNNTYGNESGTSMAGPMVAGMAAVLKSYFPKLTPEDLKRIIRESATPLHTKVLKPGGKTTIDFAELSNTGGLVNLYKAVQMAQQVQ
ncbi:S8 family serine peptidase [Hymenobacter sp. NBH84]|uniref:S8 family peptidase n=1 Tax=Hymenobacter sp. NBH84 TaxID=2596915 RepID=UPI0016294261|nr:S8 family peptidase [Hymenobacter sp. NBH84]QNE40254.1 S8 family serine peptidase [Hymenobacter sp. NBH84]